MKPYQQTFLNRGDLCFYAEVPALAHIGERFAELSESCFNYSAPEEELEALRKLCQHLAELMKADQDTRTWEQLELSLRERFATAFLQAHQRVPAVVHEYRETGQMQLAEYIEWLLYGAQTAWSLSSGPGGGPDMDEYQARIDRLTERLNSAGYESESDRQMREDDPERYAFMAQSLQLLQDSMKNPDETSFDDMISKQMELFRQSPMFDQAQQELERMREELLANPNQDSDTLRFQLEQLEQTQRFMEDPTSGFEPLADLFDGDVEADEEDGEEDELPPWPPGHLRFICGECEEVTTEHIALFRQFVDSQEQLRPQIESALRQLHGWMQSAEGILLPGDRLLFPEDPDASDVPLQCFSISDVALDAEAGTIILSLDSQFGHFDEHGCYIVIRDAVVEKFGTWDDVFGDEDFGDEDWDDDDFGDGWDDDEDD